MKRFLSLFFSVYMILISFCSVFPAYAELSENVIPAYGDIPEESWYEDYANYCFDHGYMKGTAAGVFSPSAKITRAMAVTIFCNMNTNDPYYEPKGFSDVKKGEWYYDPVEWAAYNTITGGTGNNKFSPEREITRQDFITMLYKYYMRFAHDLDAPKYDYDPFGYSDILSVSDYAVDAVAWALEYKMISGFTDATLRPTAAISRAEAVKIISVYDEKFGHVWESEVVAYRSCDTKGKTNMVCSFCGEKRTVVTDAYHVWDTGKLTVKVTCTSNGNKRFTCLGCGDYYDVSVKALGHKWQFASVIKPTPSQRGYTLYRCANCGEEKKDNYKSYVEGDLDGDGKLTIDEYLGIDDICAMLTEHESDYIGTRYVGLSAYVDRPWMLMRDKGRYPGNHSMNCTGFVAGVVERSGGDLSKLLNWNRGAYANGYNWQRTIEQKGIYHYTFYSVREALNSGKMRKGDIIYFVPPAGSDCHLGIFWGDTPYDNKIMHCTCPTRYNIPSGVTFSGVQVSGISSGTPYSYFYVLPMQGER